MPSSTSCEVYSRAHVHATQILVTRLVFESGNYFVQHIQRCSDNSRVETNRERSLIEQIHPHCFHARPQSSYCLCNPSNVISCEASLPPLPPLPPLPLHLTPSHCRHDSFPITNQIFVPIFYSVCPTLTMIPDGFKFSYTQCSPKFYELSLKTRVHHMINA